MEGIIQRYSLIPHPEGGYYREVYRSPRLVMEATGHTRRHALTAIHFLLEEGGHSRWHQVKSDEVWHHAGGGSVELLLLDPHLQEHRLHRLGPADQGYEPFLVVPALWWQAARSVDGPVLCSCFVAPGFEFEDFTFMEDDDQRAILRQRWPSLADLL